MFPNLRVKLSQWKRRIKGRHFPARDQRKTSLETPPEIEPEGAIDLVPPVLLSNPNRPLDPSKREIRLIRIHTGCAFIFRCEVMHASLDDVPEYIALSYTWHDESAAQFYRDIRLFNPVVVIEGHWVRITPNLALALHHTMTGTSRLQSSDGAPVWYWIDALCIDQENDEERTQQVAQMRDIYALADHVAVWLGHNDPRHYERNRELIWAMNSVEELYAEAHRENKLEETFYPIIGKYYNEETKERFLSLLRPIFGDLEVGSAKREALEDLLSRSWWRRIWTVQELALSQGSAFIWGGCPISIDANILVATIAYFDLLRQRTSEQWDRIYMFHYRRFDIRVEYPTRVLEYFVSQIASRCEASDPRDVIYGVLGLAHKNDMGIRPDYSLTVEEVYAKTTKTFISNYEADNPRRLGLLSLAASQQEGRFAKLPSWVPDYRRSCVCNNHYVLGYDNRYKPLQRWWASGRVPQADLIPPVGSDPMVLQVAGIRVGTVAQVGPAYRTQIPVSEIGKEASLKQLCADAYLFMNCLAWWVSCGLCPPNDRGTVRTIPAQLWFSLCNMLSLNFYEEVDASTLRTRTYMMFGGCGLVDLPPQMDPEPEKESAPPFDTCPDQVIVRYEFRNPGDLGRTLYEVVGTGDPFANAAANPTPDSADADLLRMNLAQIVNTSNGAITMVTRHAMYPPPWERDSPLSFRERLLQTALALQELYVRMRNRAVFRCSDGRLGISNDAVRPGDSVYVLMGAAVPFILRNDDEQHYSLVSEILMNGIMRGEAINSLEDVEVLKLR
jgi:hypothetical protein